MTYAFLDATGRRALLHQQLAGPHVGVAAAGRDGVFGAIPASWDVGDAHLLRGRWLLDFLDTPSQGDIIAAWKGIHGHAVMSMAVRLRGGQAATAWLIDLLEIDGVYGVLLVSDGDLADALPEPESHAPPPRVAVVRRNEFGEVVEFDDRAAALLGWTPEALADRRSLGMHHDDHAAAAVNWGSLLADPTGIFRFRARLRTQEGEYRWFDITERRRVDALGQSYVEDEIVDVGSEVAALKAVRDREARLHQLMEAVPVGIGHIRPGGGVTYANDLVRQMLSSHPDHDVASLSALSRRDRERLRGAAEATMDDGQRRELVVTRQGTGDDARIFTIVLRPLDPDDITIGVIACAIDITESRRLRDALERRANVDHLTGVSSRSHIIVTLEEHLASPDTRRTVGVLFADLDGFKAVNDRLGHAAGDAVLQVIAERLQGLVGPDDDVGRLGGDEFLLVCPHAGGAERMQELADRVIASIAEPMMVADEPIALSASVGVACVDDALVDADALVARADAQMYRAKARGGDQVGAMPRHDHGTR